MSDMETLVITRERSIGGIIPNVVISELHDDRVQVTSHPVDYGANIADHAYVEPPTIHCVFGWSDSSSRVNTEAGTGLRGVDTPDEIYKALLSVMNHRWLLGLSTGKRKYRNCIITELKTTTTSETENSLVLECSFQQVNLVSTQRTTLKAALQENPWETAYLKNRGRVAPQVQQGSPGGAGYSGKSDHAPAESWAGKFGI